MADCTSFPAQAGIHSNLDSCESRSNKRDTVHRVPTNPIILPVDANLYVRPRPQIRADALVCPYKENTLTAG